MDLTDTLRKLRSQRDRLAAVIAELESLTDSPDRAQLALRSKRGRKWMGAAERRQVSERMKRYRADRRQAQGAA